jgi:3' exoribonuclease family, domain 2
MTPNLLNTPHAWQVEVSMTEDDEPEIELSGEREGAPLDVSGVPVIVTVSQARARTHTCQCTCYSWLCCCRHDSAPVAAGCIRCSLPLASQVGAHSVVDLTAEEEPCVSAALSVAVNAAGRVVGATKSGSAGLDPGMTQEMIEVAVQLAPSVISHMDAYLANVPAAA